jgi:hypothetical protein
MTKKKLLINTILSAALFCSGVTLAQTPVQSIDKNTHHNLVEAQRLVVEANKSIVAAQEVNKKANGGDMGGHAVKARQLLVQANEELKLAAEASDAENAAKASQKKK